MQSIARKQSIRPTRTRTVRPPASPARSQPHRAWPRSGTLPRETREHARPPEQERHLDPERRTPVEFLRFGPRQQQTAGDHHRKAHPLPRTKLLHNVRHRPALHSPAKQTQIRNHHHSAKKSNSQQMKSTHNRVGQSPFPDGGAEIRALDPLEYRKNGHSFKPLKRRRSSARPPQPRSTAGETGPRPAWRLPASPRAGSLCDGL